MVRVALGPLKAKEISARSLSRAERVEMADRCRSVPANYTDHHGCGRSVSAISCGLGRSSGPAGGYRRTRLIAQPHCVGSFPGPPSCPTAGPYVAGDRRKPRR